MARPRCLAALLFFAAPAASTASARCAADASDGCRRALAEEDSTHSAHSAPSELHLLQAHAAGLAAHGSNATSVKEGSLAFIHVPCTFGHTIEQLAMANSSPDADLLMAQSVMASAKGDLVEASDFMERAKGPGGELWGMMNPKERGLSEVTGCNLYYTPGKYWPTDLAEEVFGNKTLFAHLRDPYDRVVNDFRMQVMNSDSGFIGLTRQMVSAREHSNRENHQYQHFYSSCDVNGYVKAEMRAVLGGDKFRANCHYLPQAEFYEGRFGVTVPVDNRKIPQSFNALMKEYGYDSLRMDATLHNFLCNDVSAYSLDDEAKALVRQVYKDDFALNCKYFGYCDDTEMTCLEQIPQMCGSKPSKAD